MSDDPLQTVMAQATAGWYHALCQGLKLDTGRFQLAQGNGVPFGTDSNYLWQAMDTVPPYSATNIWGSSRNVFSDGYGLVLASLQDPPDSEFQQDLGDNYNVWESYIGGYTWQPNDTYESVFRTWAQHNGIAPNQIDQLVEELDEDTPITAARAMWDQVGTSGAKAYMPDYAFLADNMRTAPAVNVTYNSSQADRTFSDTWANGNADLWVSLFGGGSSSSYQATSLATFSGTVAISMTLSHALVFAVQPLYEKSNDPYLSKFAPWYDNAVISNAYKNQANQDEIWDTRGQTDWNDAFGPTGFLRYVTSELVVVDGVNMTMNVTADFTETDTTNIRSNYAAGLFPFFFSEGQAGFSYTLDQASSAGFSVNVTCEEGNYLILGANVDDAAAAFGTGS
ncbi:MAG: hypothetical protein ABSA93_13625 [Streptosporangiaceae bacterium]